MKLWEVLDKHQIRVIPGESPEIDVSLVDPELFDEQGSITDDQLSMVVNTCHAYFDTCPFDRRLGVVPHIASETEVAWFRESEGGWVGEEA